MAGFRVTVYAAQALKEARELSAKERVTIANQAASDARSAAAVVTGEYRGGIGVEVSGDSVAIVDNDPEAFYKEYGTSDTPAHMALTNSARKYGRYSGMQARGGRG